MENVYRLFVIAGSIVVVVLFAALLAPLFIDWSSFKAGFEREASRIVGQPVRVGGAVSLRILPLPSVSFEDLEIGKNTDGTPLMTVERFSLNAELTPFLSGEVRIIDMMMLQPRVNLKIEESGAIAWTDRKQLLVDPGQVALENLSVVNGSITIDGLAGGRRLKLENLQANLSAKSLLGPWKIEAAGSVDGIPSNFKIATGILQEANSIRVKLEASRDDMPYRIVLDGPVGLEQGVLSWQGNFRTSPLPEARIKQSFEPLPVVLEGRFVATPETLEVPEYRLEAGPREDPYILTGKGSAGFREAMFFKLSADGRQIDLDRLKQAETTNPETSVESRLAALRSILERIPVPRVAGEIDIALPAIVAGDTFIREVRAVVRPLGDGWDVRSLAAIFPGNTKIELNGRVGLRGDFGFNGKIVIASRQPSGFAAWISGDVDPALRRLRSAGMSADVAISQRQATFDNLELILDDAVLRGKLQRLAPAFGQPGIIARLTGDKINLEDLQAIYALARGKSASDIANHDLDVSILAGVVEGKFYDQAFAARNVDAHVQVRGGAVSVERLNAGDIFGAAIQSTGRIENLLDKPNGNMKLSIKAGQAEALLQLARRITGGNRVLDALLADPVLTANTALEIELDTRARDEGSKGQFLVTGHVGGSRLDWQIGFDGSLENLATTRFNVAAGVSNPSPERLLRQLGFDTLPLDTPGPLSLNIEVSGIAKDGFATLIAVNAPGSDMTARGQITSPDWRSFTTSLNLTLGSQDIAPYLLITGASLPGVGVDTALPVSLTLALDHNDLETKVSSLKGQLGGNNFSGEAILKRDGLARAKLEGTLDFDRLSLPLMTAGIFGDDGPVLPIDAGAGFWSEVNFSPSLYESYDAKLALSASEVDLGGGLGGTNPVVNLEFINGRLSLNKTRFGFLDGQMAASLALKNTNGSVLAQLRYQLDDGDAAKLVEITGAPPFLSGRIAISGTLEASGRSLSAMAASASGSSVVDLANGVLHGIDPESFQRILLASDAEGFEIATNRVSTLVEDTVFDASFALGALSTAVTVTTGKARIKNLVMNAQGAKLEGGLEIDMREGALKARAGLRFNAGKEAIIGAEPEIELSWDGTLSQPVMQFDTAALEGYLSLRAFERSQRRVEILEASILEQLRLRHQVQLANAKLYYRERKAEAARLVLEEQLRKLREEEQRLKAEEARKVEETRLIEEARLAEVAKKAEAARHAEQIRQAAELAKTARQSGPQTQPEETGGGFLSDESIKNLKKFFQRN